MSCKHAQHVQAFYDAQLPAALHEQVDDHIRSCRECAELLAELRQMSQLIAAAPMADMPPALMKRLEQSWWASRDRGVLHLAEWLTGAAACVLFGALVFWHGDDAINRPAAQTASLQAIAVMPPGEMRDEPSSSSPELVLAEWMANDLSQTGGAAQP
jgi:anti-sigma factor RsiW